MRGCRDRIVVGFTTTCVISVYHHKSCEFEPCSWRGVQWFSPDPPVSCTNKADRHDIAEILLKVALTPQTYCMI